MYIKIKNGLDIPLSGSPTKKLQTLSLSQRVALDLSPFDTLGVTLLIKEGAKVKVGEPLVEDKNCSGRFFVSPASGTIEVIIRGLKRKILSIVILVDQKQTQYRCRAGTIENLMEGGLFPHIRMRPCERIAHPKLRPEIIFIKGIESAPYVPSPEIEVEGFEEVFTEGLKALQKLAPVHLVYREGSTCSVLTEAKVETHTASGPHPIGNSSVHIAAIHPITANDQVIWTLDISDVIAIGMWVTKGHYYAEKVIAVAGEGIPEEERGYYRLNRGYALSALVKNWSNHCRYISGDPLMGKKVEKESFLGFYHNVFCSLLRASEKREFLSFLKFYRKGYTLSKGYFFHQKKPHFTTRQHGEKRAFLDGEFYDQVMPLPIQTMPLIKSLITKDYEKSEALGLLEVAPEDFALPSFICPSKIEMVDIVKEGLKAYCEQHYT